MELGEEIESHVEEAPNLSTERMETQDSSVRVATVAVKWQAPLGRVKRVEDTSLGSMYTLDRDEKQLLL